MTPERAFVYLHVQVRFLLTMFLNTYSPQNSGCCFHVYKLFALSISKRLDCSNILNFSGEIVCTASSVSVLLIMLTEACLLLCTYLLYWFFVVKRHPKGFPPGPRTWTMPLVGDSLTIGKNRAKGLERLRKLYGDVYGLWYGPLRTVVVCDYETIQEVGQSPDLVDRPQPTLLQLTKGNVMCGGKKSLGGLVMGIGPSWVEQRRFALHNLRNLGFGKNLMEDLILEEVSKLCLNLETFDGKPIQVKQIFNMAVVNSLWHIVAGARFSYDDVKLKEIIGMVEEVTTGGLSGPFAAVIFSNAWLARLAYKFKLVKIVRSMETLTDFINEVIQEHRDTYQEENMRDFIDYYLREMQEQEKLGKDDSSFVGSNGAINASNVVLDLFLAGAETTSNTLNWAMFFMLNHQGVMLKVQEEIEQVTGGSRLPKYSDRMETPYTEAVLLEVQRLANIAPITDRQRGGGGRGVGVRGWLWGGWFWTS